MYRFSEYFIKKLILIFLILSAFMVDAQRISKKANLNVYEDTEFNLQDDNNFFPFESTKQSCTIIYASDGESSFGGNNEDGDYFNTNMWFIPATESKNGRVYFGFDVKKFPQGGMNDKGLFFDAAVTMPVIVPKDTTKPVCEGQLILKAMETCSTVDEVIELFNYYDFSGRMGGHYLVGDKYGNSIIIEPTTIIRKTDKYQIATNFLQSVTKPESAKDYRYDIASKVLEQTNNISLDLMKDVLEAAHYESRSGDMTSTLYSYICDLRNVELYVYNFHNFNRAVKLNLQDELKKGERIAPIKSLFPFVSFAQNEWTNEIIINKLYNAMLNKGIEEIKDLYKEWKSSEHFDYYKATDDQLISVADRLKDDRKFNEIIELCKFIYSEYPDSDVASNRLSMAYFNAGEIQLAKDNFEKSLLKDTENKEAKWYLEYINALTDPIHIDNDILESCVGKFGERKLFIEDGILLYQRGSGTKFELAPISKELFAVKGIEYYRIKIIKENNSITATEGIYLDGRSIKYMLTK